MTGIDQDVALRAGQKQTAPVIVKLRPTLFVALGGTGKEILLRLRRRILQADWAGRRITDLAKFPIASFLYFDTDTTEAIESDRAQTTDSLAGAVRFNDREKLQRKVDVARYLRELQNYRHIETWFPRADLASIDTSKGAGQVRAISRLLFFDVFNDIRSLLRAQATEVLNNVGRAHELEHLGLDIDRKLRVVVVASSAGGTGSGSFIDFGLLIRTMQDPKPEQTDLILLLPGGYSGFNAERVNANSFAALMELEHVMRPNAQPPYVTEWTDRDRPVPGVLPYDDVFLIDNANVVGSRTNNLDDMYDMVADVLFEDFGSSDFAARKRSVAVNQKQHKLQNFVPPLGAQLGPKSLSYACAYSSIGQATIETKTAVAVDQGVVVASRDMIRSYFGVALQDGKRVPDAVERDGFLRQHFHLVPSTFEEQLEGVEPWPAINEPALVEELLTLDQEKLVNRVGIELSKQFAGVRESGDLRNWVTMVRTIQEDGLKDITGRMGSTSDIGPMAQPVRKRRLDLEAALRSPRGLRADLFRRLDDRSRGGLDYTIALVEQAKVAMEEWIGRLEASRETYGKRIQDVQAIVNRSLENLDDAARPRPLLGPDRSAALRYTQHLEKDLRYLLMLSLRRQACAEAIEHLRTMSAFLGEKRGVDKDGQTVWAGAIAELIRGRTLVRETLRSFDREIDLLANAVGRADAGTYIVLPETSAEGEREMKVEAKDIADWAAQIFRDEGGSAELFPILADEARRDELILKIRGFARQKLGNRANRLRSATEVLATMQPDERMQIFRKAMERAMPWVNIAGSLGDGVAPRDRYKLMIAVDDKSEFEREFGAELRTTVPSQLGFTEFSVVNSGLRHRVIVYCELSGFPLNAITPLKDQWERDYKAQKRSETPLPLHNHKSTSRFPNPVVPTSEVIEQTRRTMGLFLRAVMTGVIKRVGNLMGEAPYEVYRGDGDWMRVGSERSIRADGFTQIHREAIDTNLRRFERSLSPVQLLALAELADWTAQRAYPERQIRLQDDRDEYAPGLAHLACRALAREWRGRLDAMPDARNQLPDREAAGAALRARLEAWTHEIAGSQDDVDAMDVTRDAELGALRNEAKRAVVPDRFTADALMGIVEAAAAGRAQAVPPPAPPVASTATRTTIVLAPPAGPEPDASDGRYKLWHKPVGAAKGTQLGPFSAAEIVERIQKGEILPETKLYPMDAEKAWLPAGELNAFAPLFEAPAADDVPDPEETIADPE